MAEVMTPQEAEPVAVADAAARREALEPARSFIVQAPAGSGKTELLTQRYLTLLARVEEPEEIIAITFTRKAAGEMRNRILEALARACEATPPDSAHARLTWELARAALAQDQTRDWSLLAHPTRLRILTIDSLCAAISRQMPLLSRLGSQPAIVDDAQELYREAARATLAELEAKADWSPAVEQLLRHLDNRLDQAESMLAGLLARRDQWLRHVPGRQDERLQRATLEAALARVTQSQIEAVCQALPADTGPELAALAAYAAENLRVEGLNSPLGACADRDAAPGATLEDLPYWQGIAAMLLTRDDKPAWRRRFDKNGGFPPPAQVKNAEEKAQRKAMKARVEALVARLAEAPELLEHLGEIRRAVPPVYSDSQWLLLEALFELLPLAVAQLFLVFQERGQVDFIEMSLSAVRALGEPEQPTDLALALDYRINHLLVDEFQDTSLSQFALLERLTAGWSEGDGRTLFVVGDPMQSIYRFREAEVGLYLQARHSGIGQLRLHPLQLTVNFRSQQGIVDWVNQAFAQVLPQHDEVATGAVSYAASTAFHPPRDTPAVSVHPLFDTQDGEEAERVTALARAALAEDPQARVAVLVRGRGHLLDILPALRRAGLRYQAIEIEHLGHRPVVQDLLALTRALLHPADRIAWLAVLRAPWCGLTLPDLHALCGDDMLRTVPEILTDTLGEPARLARLGSDGQRILARVWPVLQAAQAQRRRRRLRRLVEGTWLALGGPACCRDATDLADAQVCLGLIDSLEEGGDLPDLAQLESRIGALFARADVGAGDRLQVMTIHKSKGLEFDTVILPGLGRRPRPDSPSLLLWSERPREHLPSDLLLAPVRRSGEDHDPIYAYLQRQEARKQRHEDGRLLYVAATRARRHLHLLCEVALRQGDDGPRPAEPSATTLLGRLWSVVAGDFHQAARQASVSLAEEASAGDSAPDAVAPTTIATTAIATTLARLPVGWQRPAPQALRLPAPRGQGGGPQGEIEFVWVGETARHIGTVIHRYLQHIGRAGLAAWAPARLASLQADFRAALLQLGVSPDACPAAAERVQQALHNSLSQARGRWILSPHAEARCEYALTGVWGDTLLNVVVDRSFVDEAGVRWIIDYKTSTHQGGGIEVFLDQEVERYRNQLETYAALFREMDPRPIRLGLYFPLLGGWREWSPKTG